jgi:phospholipid/cholesterol/gamma-HCH transport system substrate-binding protein
MALSKEKQQASAIGCFAFVVLAVIIPFGWRFLKGMNVLSKTLDLHIPYDNVQQITASAPVFYKGATIGSVKEIRFEEGKPTLIINISNNPGIPKNALATIFVNGAMGGSAVELTFPKACQGVDCAIDGDKLQGTSKGLISSMLPTEQFRSYLSEVKGEYKALSDSINADFKDPNNRVNKMFTEIEVSVKNLQKTTAGMNQLVSATSNNMDAVLKNLESVSGNLKASNEQIRNVIANAEGFSGNLKQLDLKKTTDGANEVVNQLKKTLQASDKAVSDLNVMTTRLKNGDGTLGKLMADDSLYYNMNKMVSLFGLLSQDLRLNPRRYVNINPFKSYKQYEYVPLAKDPARPEFKLDSLNKKLENYYDSKQK